MPAAITNYHSLGGRSQNTSSSSFWRLRPQDQVPACLFSEGPRPGYVLTAMSSRGFALVHARRGEANSPSLFS